MGVMVTKAISALWVEQINTAAQESITSTYQMRRASSELPCPPLPTSHFHTLSKTLACDLPCGDGTATVADAVRDNTQTRKSQTKFPQSRL